MVYFLESGKLANLKAVLKVKMLLSTNQLTKNQKCIIMKPKKQSIQLAEQNILYHDSQISIIKEDQISISINRFDFKTYDIFEAVSFIVKHKSFDNSPIWSIQITEEDKAIIDPVRALYWLSGGDTFWANNDGLKDSWAECNSDYYDMFADRIYDALDECHTLLDIRSYIMTNLNLTKFYDFALSKKIIVFS